MRAQAPDRVMVIVEIPIDFPVADLFEHLFERSWALEE